MFNAAVCHRRSGSDVAVVCKQRRDVIRWRHVHHVSVYASSNPQVVVRLRLFKSFPCRHQRPLSSMLHCIHLTQWYCGRCYELMRCMLSSKIPFRDVTIYHLASLTTHFIPALCQDLRECCSLMSLHARNQEGGWIGRTTPRPSAKGPLSEVKESIRACNKIKI